MKQIPWLAFSIDRTSATPVFEQICAFIRSGAIAGRLTDGNKLPPTRAFATDLGVSRSTVVTAYEQLVAEGYLKSVQGSGYSVCAMGEVEINNSPAALDNAPDNAPYDELAPELHPFQAGQPDMRLFPYQQWAKTVSRVCRANPKAMLVGGNSFGNFELRTAIADHVSEWRGIKAFPGQIIVTAGASDAVEICTRTLTKNGDRIGLEDPGYLPLRRFVKAQGLKPVFMAIDENGTTLPRKTKDLRLVVLTPSHQFPLGGAMSPNRRLEFIHWADKANSWIIEDDYDSEFRYAGRPIPAMAGFDQLNRTIYVGSFSKIFSNALRLGYIIVPNTIVGDFRATMDRTDLRASYMPQQPLAEFINNGEFYRHLRRVRRIYSERRKFLLERLATNFTQYGNFTDHQAGMQIVFNLNPDLNDKDVSRLANKRGIRTQPLYDFAATVSSYNGLILGYCGFTQNELSVALGGLKTVLSDKLDGSGADP